MYVCMHVCIMYVWLYVHVCIIYTYFGSSLDLFLGALDAFVGGVFGVFLVGGALGTASSLSGG